MYEVFLERHAEQELNELPDAIFAIIIKVIRDLRENPRPFGCKKLKGRKSDWRVRSGNYRILYSIEDKERKVLIYRIRHRKDVYR